jgi:hypothetical protein
MLGAVNDALPEGRVIDARDFSPPEKRKAFSSRPTSTIMNPRRTILPTILGRPFRSEMGRDADDEKEEREDQIGRRPSVPRRVLERRIDRVPRPGLLTSSIPGSSRRECRAPRGAPGGRDGGAISGFEALRGRRSGTHGG